jgi:hypothetical protein
MTIINVCNLFAPIVGPLIGIINILILIAKNKKNENSFTTGCTSYKHPHHMLSSKSPRNLISTINL